MLFHREAVETLSSGGSEVSVVMLPWSAVPGYTLRDTGVSSLAMCSGGVWGRRQNFQLLRLHFAGKAEVCSLPERV